MVEHNDETVGRNSEGRTPALAEHVRSQLITLLLSKYVALQYKTEPVKVIGKCAASLARTMPDIRTRSLLLYYASKDIPKKKKLYSLHRLEQGLREEGVI